MQPVRDVLARRREHRLARRGEPAHDRRAVHVVHLRELLERDAAEEVQPHQVAIAPRHPIDRGREAGDERFAILRLDQRQLDIARRGELMIGRQLGFALFVTDSIDRGARRGHLDQAAQPAAARVIDDARSAAVGEQQSIANRGANVVDRCGRQLHPAERDRHDVEIRAIERSDRGGVTARAREREMDLEMAAGVSGGGSSDASFSASAPTTSAAATSTPGHAAAASAHRSASIRSAASGSPSPRAASGARATTSS